MPNLIKIGPVILAKKNLIIFIYLKSMLHKLHPPKDSI